MLNERIASASEIGEELGADVSSFYHHVEELEKFGCIERVESEQRRGGREHFFRAKRTVFFETPSFVHSEGPNGQERAPEQTSHQAFARSVDR